MGQWPAPRRRWKDSRQACPRKSLSAISTGSHKSSSPHKRRTETGQWGRRSSGSGPLLYEMKSKKTSAARGSCPGCRMALKVSSSTGCLVFSTL
eukprot:scaffold3296_cov159-Ochromonas_danica.AAC.4